MHQKVHVYIASVLNKTASLRADSLSVLEGSHGHRTCHHVHKHGKSRTNATLQEVAQRMQGLRLQPKVTQYVYVQPELDV